MEDYVKMYARCFKMLEKDRVLFVASTFAKILHCMISLIEPLVFARIIDCLYARTVEQLRNYIIVSLIIFVIEKGLKVLYQRIDIITTKRLEYRVRYAISQSIFLTEHSTNLDKSFKGKLMNMFFNCGDGFMGYIVCLNL